MANCGEYLLLTPKERTEFIGKVLHAVMSDSLMYAAGQRIIKLAEKKGLYTGVTINPIEPPLNELT